MGEGVEDNGDGKGGGETYGGAGCVLLPFVG